MPAGFARKVQKRASQTNGLFPDNDNDDDDLEGKKERKKEIEEEEREEGDFVFFQSPSDSASAIIQHCAIVLSHSTFQLSNTEHKLGTPICNVHTLRKDSLFG